MNKNKKLLLLAITLATVLILTSAVNATNTTDHNTDRTLSEKTSTPTTSEIKETTINKEKITSKNNMEEKTINKTDKIEKQKKTATKTVNVNNYDELTTTINNAVNDVDNNEYIINLNEGTYQLSSSETLNPGYKQPKITINGNNQILNGGFFIYLYLENKCNITINDATISSSISNRANNLVLNNCIINPVFGISTSIDTNTTLVNSTIDATIYNNGNLIISDDVIFTNSASLDGTGQIITNDINKFIPIMKSFNGNYVLENMTLTGTKTNNGNLTIKNSTVNSLENQGDLTINNSIISQVRGAGKVTIDNSTVTTISNAGNVTILNSNVNGLSLSSYANFTVKNSTLNGSIDFAGNSVLILCDDVEFGENLIIRPNANSKILYNDSYKIAKYLQYYYEDYVLENTTITTDKGNHRNLIIRNSTINSEINNLGNLTICDDVTFGEKAVLRGSGQIITNNTTRIAPYLSIYNGDNLVENAKLTTKKTNNGNLTIKNSTINTTITNNGKIILADDVNFGEKALITGNGQIITNDTTKISPYLNVYDGNYTLENTTISTAKTNKGNLTIRNSTLNGAITNNGTLIITDDCVLGNNFQIYAEINHKIISNITNITNYITNYRGNHTIENSVINKITYVNDKSSNLIIRNSTINNRIQSSGTVIFINSTINATVIQGAEEAVIIIDDDTILGKNFNVDTNPGHKKIFNATNERFPYNFNEYVNGTLTNLDIYKTNYMTIGRHDFINITLINSTINIPTQFINSSIRDSTVNSNVSFIYIQNSTISNSSIQAPMILNGKVTFIDSILNNSCNNQDTLVIGDNTILGDNFQLKGNGKVIINDTNKIAPYISEYYGNVTIEDKLINGDKTNYENLTIINSIVNGTITNKGNMTLTNSTIKKDIINDGILTIDENTVFDEGVQIKGIGILVTDNIYRLLPYLSTINGNYTIKDTTLNKSYTFNGNITIDNCTITAGYNENYGLLTITDSTINIRDVYDYWIDNERILVMDNTNNIINGNIINNGYIYDTLPSDYNPRIHIVNNKSLDIFFNNGRLSPLVNPGDTLDFQGRITRTGSHNLIIDKPVNIISSTHDAVIDDFNSVTYSLNCNVSGITLFNTQCYIGSNNVLDNISNIVDNQGVGQGTGQTCIKGDNNTIKNSFIYTRNNGGSSSLVIQGGNNNTLLNNTVQGGGGCGNLIYITSYGTGTSESRPVINDGNKILNNTIIGPEQAEGVCYGFAFTGTNNIFDGNTINYTGTGVTQQWGSGVDGDYQEESAMTASNNIITNNKLYGGCGINGGDLIYNNYIELGELYVSNATAYNNTAYNLRIGKGTSNVYNNTILNTTTATFNGIIVESTITNNNLKDIAISRNVGNLTFTHNNITGTININGTNNVFTENNITSTSDYAFNGRGTNNTITNNYITSAFNGGDASVDLNPETNTIKDNTPISTIIGIVDDLRINIYETETITFNITNSNNEIINKGNIIIKDETGNTLLEQTINGEEINLDLYYEERGVTMLTAQYTDETGEHLNATKTIRVVKLVPPTQTQINDETPVLGESTELTATFFQTDGTPVNGGKAIFRVNGKTLRDDQGNVIYADVINGHVQPLTVNITNEWMKPDTTIQAIYSGTDEFEPIITQPTTVTIAQPEATITLDAPTEATAGTTITLKATVTDGDTAINSGRVAFKLNGKTLKNAEGKALYANVENGIATITYTIPEKTKAKEYTLTAVFTDTKYDRVEAESKLNVVKA